jgi:amino acid adenylation domain-containing protein
MSIAEFVSDLKKLDVRLSVNGQTLRVNAPKGVLTDTLRTQIAERKQELLQFLSDDEQSAAFIPPPILRRTSSDPAPLSFAQERLWFLEQLESGSAVYNICRASRLIGQLNVLALKSSLAEILRRHEILRSQIRIVDGRPVQVAVAVPRFEVAVIDLRSLTEAERDREVCDRIKAEAARQFDLSAGLFLRAVLLQISDDQHILILTTHHIVSDAWSMGILTKEVWTLYNAYANGNPPGREDLPIQYGDYAAWQREWLQGEALEGQLSYWRKQLDSLPVLSLPTDHPRPAKQSFHGARVPITLPQSLTTAVNELSRREGVTQFMTLLAAFQVLLYRYSGQEDIVVGSPIANRNRTETEGLIGFFVNTLVLRADLSGQPTFKELLQRVRDVCLIAYAHQDLPFERLVEELRPERDLSRNPLFQLMFVLQNTPRTLPQPAGLNIERLDVLPATSPFDLSLYLRERDGKIVGFFEFNTDLFESSTLERMVGHFQTLLEGIVADPEQLISTLPLLTEAERHQLLVEWNKTTADYPKDSCIHQLFEARVERSPRAIALHFEGKKLTYRELNARANRLAHYLQGLGVGPGKLVGICVERSLEMVVGLLGILKAGGAYVPLDPAYPGERVAFMLKDAGVSVLLTQQGLIEDRISKIEDRDLRSSLLGPQMKVVCLDTDGETIARENEQNPRSEVKPDNLAYVIYTSGSTGKPKGVAIEHRNTVALLCWAKNIFTIDELAGVLASTSICFDLSIFELFVPLSWGGKVILAENALHLSSITEKNEVTLINTVPSVMVELLAVGDLPTSVRTINLAGEPLRSELVKQIYESTNVDKVYDLYGPSEATTYSTFTLRTAAGPPTIGRPISNTRIYILDGNLQPVPIGVAGELYVGGVGVARGYLNRPDLTVERFISSSFNANGGERIYRTGDLARYRPEGDIEFLGRADNQVKIHGYRIELGEIEAVLIKHPTVKDCIVGVCEHESWTRKNLVGYVVPRDHSVPSVTELRSYLRGKLPEYMVPSVFMILDTLPLTHNGKLDRQKLPPLLYDVRIQIAQDFEIPRTEIEQLIGQVCQGVLRIENIGVHDNFFEIGGHSLLAVQMVSRLREAFNREIPFRALFETPTIAGLAVCIEGFIRDGRASDLPTILPVSRERPLPLSINQEHVWNLDQMVPGTHFFNMPYVYHLRGDLNLGALKQTFREIVRRHEALRTVFIKVDGCPVQVIKDGSDFQLAVDDLRSDELDEVSQQAAALILKERQRPFDLETGPLLRTKLFRLKDTEHLLLITMHHIVSDHWSMQILRGEIAALYDAFSQGCSSPLADPVIQFADFACWERRILKSGLFNDQLAYWRKQLADPLLKLDFKKNERRDSELSFRTSSKPIELDESLFASIKSLAGKENCTPFMVVVTALNVVLHLFTGQRDIRIATLVANRGRKEIGEVIGHFLNTVILRTIVSPDLTFKQVLNRVRDITIAAYSNQELPFRQLAHVMKQEKDLKADSLVQVLLSYQISTMANGELPGLTIAPLSWQVPNEVSEAMLTTYDLIFRLRETSTTLTGSVNSKTNTLDSKTSASIIHHFGATLKEMMSDTERLISATVLNVES